LSCLAVSAYAQQNKRRRPQKPRKRPVDNLPVSCHQIFMKNINNGCKKSENGFFQIKPAKWLKPKWAECVFDWERGWTVVQSRYNGKENFNRPMKAYKNGFGCPVGDGRKWDNTHCYGEVWLGLDYWYWLQRAFGKPGSKLCNYVASANEERSYEYVCYDIFQIDSAKRNFKILKADGFNDYMTELGDNYRAKGQNDLLGAAFSAIDSDNDKSRSHCAKDSKSGWWFNNCSSLNLNAEWDAKTGRGIFWDNPKNQSKWNNLKFTKIFIGPHRSKEYPCLQKSNK